MTSRLEKKITFTKEQLAAIDALKEFVLNPFQDSWYFVFSGYAGTGKTTCMKRVDELSREMNLRVVYTAPTNKAVKVLRGVVGDGAKTTYSFLGLRVMANGSVKEIFQNKVGAKAQEKKDEIYEGIDVVVVDEASMVNKLLFKILKEFAYKYRFRVVFMGDLAQLPPVGEAFSPAMHGPVGASLETVMRHDNQILKFATHIREQMDLKNPKIVMKNDNDGEEGVWVLDRMSFKEMIFAAAKEGEFDGETSKIIAWRNDRVKYYNNLVRIALYGNDAVPGYFLKGERITAGTVCQWGDGVLMNTDDDGVIEEIEETVHPIHRAFKVFKLNVLTDDDDRVELYKLHPDSEADYEDHLSYLRFQASETPRMWSSYWKFVDSFHDVRYSYASTAHKAQGSTYINAYVDSSDIMMNPNEKESLQCFYVGSTRPSLRLFLS